MRSPRSRRSTAPSRSSRSGPACPRGPPTTTSATAPPRCSPRLRSRPARSPTAAMTATARPSSWTSSSSSPRPTRADELHVVLDNYHTHKHDDINPLAGQAPADHAALHPDLRILAEPRRGVLRDHHPPGHPPRILRQRQTTHRRDPRLHRRLQRPLPTLHLDQDRRRDPATSHPSTNFRRATLVAHAGRRAWHRAGRLLSLAAIARDRSW